MSPESYDEPTRQLMDIRLALLTGEAAQTLEPLRQLHARHPENPYTAYTLGCAEMIVGQTMENPAEMYKHAATLMNRANDLAPGPALRVRAAQASTWLKSVLAEISSNPELFSTAAPPAAAPPATGAPEPAPAAPAEADTAAPLALPPPPK